MVEVVPGARHVVLPEGIVSTDWPAVRETCSRIGVEFDEWQAGLNRAILAMDEDGLYAADTVALSVCRQAGKTFDIGMLVFADAIINPGTTTIWTAHRFKVARESFNELRALAKSPLLAPHVDYESITTAAGNETIPFRNGSRIVFAARERGAIRGFTKVRRLILDEAQILTEAQMSDLAPTMNQASNPQIIMMGTPPRPRDPGEVFSATRTTALDGDSEGALYVEFSADPSAPGTLASAEDWEQVEKANPSFPHRTNRRAIKRLRKLLTDDDDYRREALGIWDAESRVTIFEGDDWDNCRAAAIPDGVEVTGLSLALSFDRKYAAIAAAGVDADGVVWSSLLYHAPQSSVTIEAAAEFAAEFGVRPVVDDAGPAARLLPDLEAAGVDVLAATFRNAADAFERLEAAVGGRTFRHVESAELDRSAAGAVVREVGDRRLIGRKKSASDVSPLEASCLASWSASAGPAPAATAYETRGLLVI